MPFKVWLPHRSSLTSCLPICLGYLQNKVIGPEYLIAIPKMIPGRVFGNVRMSCFIFPGNCQFFHSNNPKIAKVDKYEGKVQKVRVLELCTVDDLQVHPGDHQLRSHVSDRTGEATELV